MDEGAATAQPDPLKRTGDIVQQAGTLVTSTAAPNLWLSCAHLHCNASISETLKALWDANSTPRMLGLSRAYPYILDLNLSKWDACLVLLLFHKRGL